MLEDVTNQAIRLTKAQLDELERRCSPEDLEASTILELQNLTGMISKLQRGLATVIKEARALLKDAQDAAAVMSQDQLDEVLVESFLTRSSEGRKAFFARLRKADKDNPCR